MPVRRFRSRIVSEMSPSRCTSHNNGVCKRIRRRRVTSVTPKPDDANKPCTSHPRSTAAEGCERVRGCVCVGGGWVNFGRAQQDRAQHDTSPSLYSGRARCIRRTPWYARESGEGKRARVFRCTGTIFLKCTLGVLRDDKILYYLLWLSSVVTAVYSVSYPMAFI